MKIKHYQVFNNDMISFCGRAVIYVGDISKRNSTVYKKQVTCKHCIARLKKETNEKGE